MGALFSCCQKKDSDSDFLTPSLETKRQQQADAAERRLREQECRGIKDVERYKQKRERIEAMQKKQNELAHSEPSKLTWTVG